MVVSSERCGVNNRWRQQNRFESCLDGSYSLNLFYCINYVSVNGSKKREKEGEQERRNRKEMKRRKKGDCD